MLVVERDVSKLLSPGSVSRVWNGLAMLVVERDVSKLLSPGSVHRVGESRVVAVQLAAVAEDLVGKPIQVLDFAREPGHRVLVVLVEAGDDLAVAGGVLDLLQSAGHLSLLLVELHHELVARETS